MTRPLPEDCTAPTVADGGPPSAVGRSRGAVEGSRSAAGRSRSSFRVAELAVSRAAEAALAALARGEILDHFEIDMHHGHDHHLRDSIAGIDGERGRSAIPAGHHQRSLIIGIDQADEITQHDAAFVPEPGARQQQRRECGSST